MPTEIEALTMALPDIDPDTYEKFVVDPDALDARIKTIKHVRETWKGNSGYRDTIDMEIWAMELASALMTVTRVSMVQELAKDPDIARAFPDGMERGELNKLTMVSLERIFQAAKLLRGES